MGGYSSGRKACVKKIVEQYYSIDVCWCYRNGLLEPGRKAIVRFDHSFAIKTQCMTHFWGCGQCLHVKYPALNRAGKVENKEQVIGFEWVMNGKARRPYFYCPMLGILAGKLLMGRDGLAHRRWYGPHYFSQTLGHFDRALWSCRLIKKKLGDSVSEFATDLPLKPKGMHKHTYQKYLDKHRRLALPAVMLMDDWCY